MLEQDGACLAWNAAKDEANYLKCMTDVRP